MPIPRLPCSETERLASLYDLDNLDADPDAGLHALVRTASLVCDMPVSLIGLIDKERQWFKADIGLPDVAETLRGIAFCAHAILDDAILEIPDITQDQRFADDSLIGGQSAIRFYAGAPIRLQDGSRVGALCVMDCRPGILSDVQRKALTTLAGAAAAMLESQYATNILAQKNRRLKNIVDSTRIGVWERNIQTGAVQYNERWAEILGYTLEELEPLSTQIWLDVAHPDDVARSVQLLQEHLAGRTALYQLEVRLRHKDGHWIWALDSGRVMAWTASGEPEWLFGTLLDITERKQQEEALRKSNTFLDRIGPLAGVGGWEVDLLTGDVYFSEETRRIYGVDNDYRPSVDGGVSFYAPESRPIIRAAIEHAKATGEGWDLELPFIRQDERRIWVRSVGTVEFVDAMAVRLVGAFQDVSERVAERLALQEAQERIALATDSGGIGIWQYDLISGKVDCDAWMYRLFGMEPRQQAETLAFLTHNIHPDDLDNVRQNSQDAIKSKEAFQIEYRILWPDGSLRRLHTSTRVIRDQSGWALRLVGTAIDVTEQRRLSDEMRFRATHDTLTGLFNRAEFENYIAQLLLTAQDNHIQHVLLFLDLDQFKLVNDTCGHLVGDQLLQQIASLLKETVPSVGTMARLGGDEFGILLEHCTTEQAQAVAQQVCDRMDDFRFTHEGRRFRVGTSIGLVPVDKRWSATAAILQAAETSCYAAKEAGRNRVHAWFDADQTMRARHGEMQWTTRIEQALDEDKFVLFAQHIAPLQIGAEVIHAEVLLRMIDHDGSLVPPGLFLPAAERFHLASRIDRWVLRHAIAWMKALPSLEGIGNLSVNLSGQSVGDRAFHRWAIGILENIGPAICSRLCFEITETAAVTNLADAAAFVEQVHAKGVRVALDDFGAGASSFGYLKMIPADYLKIDGQFVRDLLIDPLDEVAVRCFVDVAKVVGVSTVAEFVEQPAVLERLRAIGVDFAQGYLIHKPAPLDELTRLVLAHAVIGAV